MGSQTSNTLPTSDFTLDPDVPAALLTMPYTVERPSPVALPRSFVVKNGSKMRVFVSSLIPAPLSRTSNRAYRPAATPMPSTTLGVVDLHLIGLDGMRPPRGIASRALTTRFTTTCPSCPLSAQMAPTLIGQVTTSSTSAPISRRMSPISSLHDRAQIERRRIEHLLAG